MKRILVLATAMVCINVNAQVNNVPTSGPVAIGISTPHAGKQLTVNGEAKLLNSIEIDGNTTIDGSTQMNGNVRMHGLTTYSGNPANMKVIVTDASGDVQATSLFHIVSAAMNAEPFELALCHETLINNPRWFSGPNKLFAPCTDVNVGIGTQSPEHLLTVIGITYSKYFLAGSKTASNDALFNGFSPNNSQKLIQLGNKITSEEVRFTVENAGATKIKNVGNESTLTLDNGTGHAVVINANSGDKILQLEDNGLLRGRKMRLDATSWADYVFAKDYQLTSLKNTKQYIEENGHLPNVPSEHEIVENGVDVTEMLRIQMEKIEELTLHMIEMNEKIEQLEKENEHLKK